MEEIAQGILRQEIPKNVDVSQLQQFVRLCYELDRVKGTNFQSVFNQMLLIIRNKQLLITILVSQSQQLAFRGEAPEQKQRDNIKSLLETLEGVNASLEMKISKKEESAKED